MATKNIDELKETIKNHNRKYDVLYEWVKSDIISLNQFKALIEYIRELEK